METTTAHIGMAVPDPIRTIFGRWAEPCDPALAGAGTGAEAGALYGTLSGARAGLGLSPAALARIRADARHNRHYGQFAELRREGEQVLKWVRAVLAAGPAPQRIFIPF